MTFTAVLVVDRRVFSMGSLSLMTTQTIVCVKGLAKILFIVGGNLHGGQPRHVVPVATLRRMAGLAGFLEVFTMDR